MSKENKISINISEALELFYNDDSDGTSNFETLSDIQNMSIVSSIKNAGTKNDADVYEHLETGTYIVSHSKATGEARIVKVSNETKKTFSEMVVALKAFNKKTNSQSSIKDIYVVEKSEDADMTQRQLLGIYINSGAIKEGEFLRNVYYMHISKFLDNGICIMKSVEFKTVDGFFSVMENPFHLIRNSENNAIFGYLDAVTEIICINNNEYSDLFSTYGEAKYRKEREGEITQVISTTLSSLQLTEEEQAYQFMDVTAEGVYYKH